MLDGRNSPLYSLFTHMGGLNITCSEYLASVHKKVSFCTDIKIFCSGPVFEKYARRSLFYALYDKSAHEILCWHKRMEIFS